MQGIEITKPLAEVNKKTIEEGLPDYSGSGKCDPFCSTADRRKKHIDEMIEKLKRALA